MKRSAIFLVLLSALSVPASANALGFIIVGNQPLGSESGYGKELFAAVNVEERVYAYIHDWHLTFHFKGGPKALNEAMRRFAAIPADRREIILLSVPAKPLIHDKKPIDFDWSLDVPGSRMGVRGRRVVIRESEIADARNTLTIYIPEPLPPAAADPQKARQWIAAVGSDDFKTRERAAKELADLGPSVASLLREALKGHASAEARDRMERILAGMSKGIRLDVLEFPEGVPVVSLEVHLARCRKELANKDPEIRGDAACRLSDHGALGEDVLLDLEKVLKTETAASPLIGAARGAWILGAAARPLVPILRETAKTADKNVAIYCEQAIANIEKATAEPVSDAEATKRATIRKEIREFVAGLKQKATN
jgi:hypothetical protein